MKTSSFVVAAALISGSVVAAAQPQFDTPGSSTPGPKQEMSTDAAGPAGSGSGGAGGERASTSQLNSNSAGSARPQKETIGSGIATGDAKGSSTTPPMSSNGVATPGGLTND